MELLEGLLVQRFWEQLEQREVPSVRLCLAALELSWVTGLDSTWEDGFTGFSREDGIP